MNKRGHGRGEGAQGSDALGVRENEGEEWWGLGGEEGRVRER